MSILLLLILSVGYLLLWAHIGRHVFELDRRFRERMYADYRCNDNPPGHLAALHGIPIEQALAQSLALLEQGHDVDITHRQRR